MMKKLFQKWQLFFTGVVLFFPAILFAQNVAVPLASGDDRGITGIANNISVNFLGTGKELIYAACYVIGIMLLVTANHRYKIHRVAPRGLGVANSVFLAICGILLILIPLLTQYISGAPL